MRKAEIYFKGDKAGLLTQNDDGSFVYRYKRAWYLDSRKPPISLTFPKTQHEYYSKYLFAFFYHMLPEGRNKEVVCKYLRIDKNDDFGLLLATATYDTIGAVTVRKKN